MGRTDDALADLLGAADLRPEDVELALLAALAGSVSGEEDRAYEFVERARLQDTSWDLPLVEAVWDRVEEGHEASKTFLEKEFVSGALRERLMTCP